MLRHRLGLATLLLIGGSSTVLAQTPCADGRVDTAPGSATVERTSAPAAQRLAAELARLDGFAARFDQAIAGPRGEIIEQSSGEVLLLRPNFRWSVDAPYPQVIVTEGSRLKVYDPDLEQLTIRSLDEALSETPIALLTRDDVAIEEAFIVTTVPDAPVETFRVEPRDGDSLFAEIRLAFDAAGLTTLGILDHLGQYTEIRFRPQPDRVIQSADFELEVPPETDVIGG